MFLSVIFLLLSYLIKKNTENTRKKNNIKSGKITYSDLNKPASPFFSKKYMLAGKPDYIIQKNKKIIPVEYKSTVHKHPRKNHIYQLAAYCHLIEENSKSFVPYGVLVYNDKTFNISYDPKLRFELEEIISSMRNIMKSGKIYRNHNEINRCKNCSMRNNCDLKLI